MTAPLPAPHRGLAIATWFATLGALGAGIAGLHALGPDAAFTADLSDPWSWIGAHSPERVLLVLGRLAVLGLGYWTLGSLLASTLARASRVPGLIRSMDRVTMPFVRRTADRIVAVSLAVGSVTAGSAGVAWAADPPTQESETTPVVVIHQGEAVPPARYVPVPAADAPVIPAPSQEDGDIVDTPVPAGTDGEGPLHDADASIGFGEAQQTEQQPAGARFDASTGYDHDVVSGDNLWTIAERHLERVLQREVTEAETATYWVQLLATNAGQFRSGDPDLIYPGEIVVCPAAADVGLGG